MNPYAILSIALRSVNWELPDIQEWCLVSSFLGEQTIWNTAVDVLMNGQYEEHKYYSIDIIITIKGLNKTFENRLLPGQETTLDTMPVCQKKLIINFNFTFTRDEQSKNYRVYRSNDKYHVPWRISYPSSKGNETHK